MSLKSWFKARSAYFNALLVLFPTAWLGSAELQAALPPALVSKIAILVGLVRFYNLYRASLPPKVDESDKAGA